MLGLDGKNMKYLCFSHNIYHISRLELCVGGGGDEAISVFTINSQTAT